jgi:hypothetical protein
LRRSKSYGKDDINCSLYQKAQSEIEFTWRQKLLLLFYCEMNRLSGWNGGFSPPLAELKSMTAIPYKDKKAGPGFPSSNIAQTRGGEII